MSVVLEGYTDLLCSFFWVIPWHLNFIYWRFGTLYSIFIGVVSRSFLLKQPMKMDQTECSETSVYIIQAGESPKRKNTTFRTRWKFEIKNYTDLLIVVEFFPNYHILELAGLFDSLTLHSVVRYDVLLLRVPLRTLSSWRKNCIIIPTLKNVQWCNKVLSIHLEMYLNTADILKKTHCRDKKNSRNLIIFKMVIMVSVLATHRLS